MLYGLATPAPEEPTIRVRMLRTKRATVDGGCTTFLCEAGKDYDLPEWLANSFFIGGNADPAEAHEMADLENKRLTTQGLDKGATVTHAGAVDTATEHKDDPQGRAVIGDERSEPPGKGRRSRGPRRLHGE